MFARIAGSTVRRNGCTVGEGGVAADAADAVEWSTRPLDEIEEELLELLRLQRTAGVIIVATLREVRELVEERALESLVLNVIFDVVRAASAADEW